IRPMDAVAGCYRTGFLSTFSSGLGRMPAAGVSRSWPRCLRIIRDLTRRAGTAPRIDETRREGAGVRSVYRTIRPIAGMTDGCHLHIADLPDHSLTSLRHRL